MSSSARLASTATTPDDLRGHLFHDGSTSSQLAAGEVGCYASHMKVWKLILERQLTHALVLEDDAILARDLVTTVDETLNQAPAEWGHHQALQHVGLVTCRSGPTAESRRPQGVGDRQKVGRKPLDGL